MGEGISRGIQPGTAEYDEVKRKLNQGGFQKGAERDDNDAAVFVGTREEAAIHRLRLESEGAPFADLRSYISVNSFVAAGAEEIREAFSLDGNNNLSESFEKYPPGLFKFIHNKPDFTILFKSKDGSLKECTIDMKRISDMGDPAASAVATGHATDNPSDITIRSLSNIGFTFFNSIPGTNLSGCYEIVLQQRAKKLAAEKSSGAGFEF
ncbi:MAG: hypothetical protein A2821_01560 [Candidatus Magasanikbacteria bacterium RIFCSPHIGHO2_01_FULL_41_23]|uniref:Uncharacterized protein n=1 Tax=Candidatus Magasanikbacteria bacterium RIFCSPLOWO2_01_FULL_40_15 TaxID=1798686 RepID=A0A1F6N248_9BACT|nr:MAG: hypothetical protein A2821_01560 [Candidatus Magasanikbacteria bacterium RIFCSPHIGHO2_01_FULL_41_23]OGH66807.1 MAG: hypothetical protein A3C66_01865 [Candidatus Magasanikbacteria bacterium RIFCSPHIGHO2_02_FULL_41_35]OGH76673.1 MAG: hypothetical protein A3F22_01060 [Candidatus Magasanikbacteria bacterium RIFCSPHIGHO2_12_FULL_41_16]OGH78009.1 MAG: hypothetical protein A2983_02505 [Candidatus Magasanikbacteria bacterium RIFCSPLOWO2_01_FULL_40_15]